MMNAFVLKVRVTVRRAHHPWSAWAPGHSFFRATQNISFLLRRVSCRERASSHRTRAIDEGFEWHAAVEGCHDCQLQLSKALSLVGTLVLKKIFGAATIVAMFVPVGL
jgi:hypothetical protein